jgi:hypothetical protein
MLVMISPANAVDLLANETIAMSRDGGPLYARLLLFLARAHARIRVSRYAIRLYSTLVHNSGGKDNPFLT